MKRNISINFILDKQKPTWSQVSLGLDEGWLKHSDVIYFAERLVSEGDVREETLEIASTTDVNSSLAKEITSLVQQESEEEQMVRLYWLRIILAWVYENRLEFEDPLSIVEGVYADFGYPEEIRNIIRYNEPTDGYRPQDHGQQENDMRLVELWKRYLESVFSNT